MSRSSGWRVRRWTDAAADAIEDPADMLRRAERVVGELDSDGRFDLHVLVSAILDYCEDHAQDSVVLTWQQPVNGPSGLMPSILSRADASGSWTCSCATGAIFDALEREKLGKQRVPVQGWPSLWLPQRSASALLYAIQVARPPIR